MKAEYLNYANKMSQKYGIPFNLVQEVMRQESGGNPNAISKAGAIGLMQLMPGTAKGLKVNPYDPYQNIEGGVKYLSQNYKTYGGDVDKTLASYNAGAGAVAKYGGVPPYKETQNYVKTIRARLGLPNSGFSQSTPVIGEINTMPVVPPIKKVGLNQLVQGSGKPLIEISQLNKTPNANSFDTSVIANNYNKKIDSQVPQWNQDKQTLSDKLGSILGVGGQFDNKVNANPLDVRLNPSGQRVTNFEEAKSLVSDNQHPIRNQALMGGLAGAGLGTAMLPGIGTVAGAGLGSILGAIKGNKQLNDLASRAVKGATVADNLVNQEVQNVRVLADTANRVNSANVKAGGVNESYNINSALNQVGSTTDSKGVLPLLQNAFDQGNTVRNNKANEIKDQLTSLIDARTQAQKIGDLKTVQALSKQIGIFNNQLSLLQSSNLDAILQGRAEGLGGLNQILNTSVDLNKMSNQSALAQALANTESKTQLGVANIGKDAQLGVAGIGLKGQELGYEAQKEMFSLPFDIGRQGLNEINQRSFAIQRALEKGDISQLVTLIPGLTILDAEKAVSQVHNPFRKLPLGGLGLEQIYNTITPGSINSMNQVKREITPYQNSSQLMQLLLGNGGSK